MESERKSIMCRGSSEPSRQYDGKLDKGNSNNKLLRRATKVKSDSTFKNRYQQIESILSPIRTCI